LGWLKTLLGLMTSITAFRLAVLPILSYVAGKAERPMKKNNAICVLSLFSTLFFCQNLAAQQRFQGSLVGGINLSQIDGDLLNGFDQFGLHGGLRAVAILSDRWQLGIELLYNQQGARRDLNSNPASIYDNIRLNLVEAPVLILFQDWKFQVGGGVSYSRIMRAKVIDVFGDDITDTQNFRQGLINVVAATTFQFSEKWALDLRWTRMLSNLREDRANGLFIGRTISIRAMYKL
jgi:Outer membrane protein beta-barrel domain